MECIRRLCCFKKQKIDEVSEDDSFLVPDQKEDFTPVRYAEPLVGDGPASFFRSSVLSIYKIVDSIYKKPSEWSLPKETRVNLFALSKDDMELYEENDFFDDVVDETF